MPLIRLIYESTLNSDHEPTLALIFGIGRRNNSANHISGITLVSGRQVFEILEGERDVVEETFQRIAGDTRHHINGVLIKETIDSCHFFKWNVGFRRKEISSHPENTWKDTFLFDGTNNFSVHQCPTDVAHLLDDFARRYPVRN